MSIFKIEYLSDDEIKFNNEIIFRCYNENCCRLIFMTNDYVIKCDNWVERNSGSKQSEDEYKKYLQIEKSNSKYKEFFVPIIDFGEIFDGYYYVVQPRIEINIDENYDFYNDVKDICAEFWITDTHNGNYSVVGNDVLIFDYSF